MMVVAGMGPSNSHVHDALARYVGDTFLPGSGVQGSVERGPLEVNLFSVCFWMNTHEAGVQKGVYVKIPKRVLFQKGNEQVLPLSTADRTLAEDEYASLEHLSRHWGRDELRVRFVTPLAFLKDYNAIVTERVYARHFFTMFRRCHLRGIRRRKSDQAHEVLTRLGAALAKFHRTSMRECPFDFDAVVEKMLGCCAEIKLFGAGSDFLDGVMGRLRTLRIPAATTHHTHTLKGFDVRQVFINEDRDVFLLDPGKIKPGYQEVDLARFIVTCRILFWGSLWLPLGVSPDASYEARFVESYYGTSVRPANVLGVLTIKELLKHWRMAYQVLEWRQWHPLIRAALGRTYIDPFFQRQVTVELGNLES
jgi:hypothetical protein